MLVRGENMIKTYKMLKEELKEYKAVDNKIARLVQDNKIVKLKRGLYETDPTVPGYLVANALYVPSYLSFEFALSYHGLIPERVYSFTSATFDKGRKKHYNNKLGDFYYRDIPPSAYPYEVLIKEELGYHYQIASAEKALCDKLYTLNPIRNQKELIEIIFSDLRIDEEEFELLNKEVIYELIDLYSSTNLNLLEKVLKKYE